MLFLLGLDGLLLEADVLSVVDVSVVSLICCVM
jgi:hypothetical protein